MLRSTHSHSARQPHLWKYLQARDLRTGFGAERTICYLCSPIPSLLGLRVSIPRVPMWLQGLSIQLLISAQVMISPFVVSSPMSGSAEPAWEISVSLSLCPFPTLSLSLSLKINKHFFKKFLFLFPSSNVLR